MLLCLEKVCCLSSTLATYQSVIHPYSIFWLISNRPCTHVLCIVASRLHIGEWGGEKEKGLEEVLYCSREVWSSAGKLVRHNSRTPVHTVVKFNKLWGSFHQSFPVPLCHERGNTAESEERSTTNQTFLNTPPASSSHCTCSYSFQSTRLYTTG